MRKKGWLQVEVVRYDPRDPETYPSVCSDPGEVEARFGFHGGEFLVFDSRGNYLGELQKSMTYRKDIVAKG